MIRYTPQELANIFQCYVSEDRDYNVFKLYTDCPVLRGDSYLEWEGDSFMELHKEYVEIPHGHEWYRCYAPESVKVKGQMMEQIKERTEQLKKEIECCYEQIFPKSLDTHYLLKEENDL